MKEYEDMLLGMPFEVMLTQVVNLPTKFFIQDIKGKEMESIEKFDKMIRQIKIPTMLLERLKREFDQNFKKSNEISQANQ